MKTITTLTLAAALAGGTAFAAETVDPGKVTFDDYGAVETSLTGT